jgi:hypothetical protein
MPALLPSDPVADLAAASFGMHLFGERLMFAAIGRVISSAALLSQAPAPTSHLCNDLQAFGQGFT